MAARSGCLYLSSCRLLSLYLVRVGLSKCKVYVVAYNVGPEHGEHGVTEEFGVGNVAEVLQRHVDLHLN